MGNRPPRTHRSGGHRSWRRLSFEPLEPRVLLDTGAAELADDLFQLNQNGLAQRLDVLANDDFGPGYAGAQRITSVSYGSEGGRVEIVEQGGAIQYAPPADLFGTETFVYYVDDSLSATVSVTISSPLEFDQYEFLPDGETRVLDVLANDPFWPGYDGPGEITFVSETRLGNDVAIAADGQSILYTPARDAHGKDSFVYIVDDLYPARVTIKIPDLLKDDQCDVVEKSENNRLRVLANDPFWSAYPGARDITFVSQPESGATLTIAGDGKSLLYTPPADFTGRDRFAYVVDGVHEASVSVQVHRPVKGDRFEMDMNSTGFPMMVTQNDYFEEVRSGIRRDIVDRVTWVGETAQGGTVEIMPDGEGVYYSAPAGYEGRDSFAYVADGKYEARVSVNITAPVRDDHFSDSGLDYFGNRAAGAGVYEDTVDNVLCVLRNDFKGNGYQGPRIITSVGPAIDRPYCPRFVVHAYLDEVVLGAEGGVLEVTRPVSEPAEGGTATEPAEGGTVGETAKGGTVTISPGGSRLLYTPAPGFRGMDRFSYTVDGEFQANVTIHVGPIIGRDHYAFVPDPSITEYVLDVLENDHFRSNYPGAGLITAVSETAHGGTVTIADDGRSIRFAPAQGRSDRFTYTVDGKYEASVWVSFLNFLRDDSFVVGQNSTGNELNALANDFRRIRREDYRGPRQVTSVGECEHGGTVTVAADGVTLLYSPAPDFFGKDRFTYTVDELMTATVTVHVIRRVRDDQFRVEADSQGNVLPVLINDLFGADYSGAGRITAVTETSEGGTATVGDDGRSIVYTPPAGFTGQDKLTYTVDGKLKAEATVWVGTSIDEMLPRFESWANIEQFLLDDALERYEHLFGSVEEYKYAPAYALESAGQAIVTGSDVVYDADGSPSHSETNVQVAGVDEGDIIETDGDYLYILTGDELIIADAWPAQEMSVVSRVTVEGDQVIAEYLDGDRLTVISRRWEDNGRGRWWWRGDPVTLVTIYDVSDRHAPTVVQKTEIDGGYVESRRIDGSVFLVLHNSRVNLWLPKPHRELVDDAYYVYETAEQYVERMKAEMEDLLEARLPDYAAYDADGELVDEGWLHAPEDLCRPPSADARNLVSVVSLNMRGDEPGPVASTGIFTTWASKIYGSLDNLYVFDGQHTWEDGSVTQILKFDWDADTGGIELAAKGQVAGRMLNQFSADEHDGYLRIATTVSNSHSGNWSRRSENVLFVLRDDGGVLEMVGGMQNLALEETIRSVRFLGDRAFVTTFRNIDPLFALDLSDPAQPRSCGHITMPGYNSYMQVIDQNHILTVGRNTPTGTRGPTQVSLFDVTDLSRPRLIDQYTFERFSTSEAEADHHAFGWFAEHQVLAVPCARVFWQRVDEDGDGFRETRQRVREDELLVFKIDVSATRQSREGIEPLGGIEHDSPVRRSAFIEHVLYSVANDSVQAVSIADPAVRLGQIDLEAAPEVEPQGSDGSAPGGEEPAADPGPTNDNVDPAVGSGENELNSGAGREASGSDQVLPGKKESAAVPLPRSEDPAGTAGDIDHDAALSTVVESEWWDSARLWLAADGCRRSPAQRPRRSSAVGEDRHRHDAETREAVARVHEHRRARPWERWKRRRVPDIWAGPDLDAAIDAIARHVARQSAADGDGDADNDLFESLSLAPKSFIRKRGRLKSTADPGAEMAWDAAIQP